jgi:tripartite-type tricarboxylate transporter receptor subunit TctC
MIRRFAQWIIVPMVLLALPGFGNAQTAGESYPVKPVRIIAPFPPGGSVDTVGRLIGARLSESYGQTFVIDNRSGASGSIGMEIAANAPADGYTLVINTLPLITNQFLFSKLPYDALRDFAPVSLLTTTASVFLAHPSLPAKTVRELIALAGSRKEALHYGGAGPGTNPHIAGELFNHLAKTNLTIIQFKGGGPAMIATVSGEISLTIPAVTDGLPFIRSGRLRALGVSSLKRVAQLPEVPAIAETLPGYEFTSWQGLLAPKNTPRAIVAALSERIKKSLAVTENARRFHEGGLEIVASTPDEFAAHLKMESAKWGKVFRERGMKLE